MNEWKTFQDRKSCVSYYGNMKQIAGLRRCVLTDGKAKGVEAIDVKTGSGLEYTILPGRGMDLVDCRYKGMPISYLSKTGITSSAYYDPRENQWLKSFFAGMLTTCGISNAGPACYDENPFLGKIPYGLHGDISNTEADNVCAEEVWDEDVYQLKVSGRMFEGRLHGEHLSLRRNITSQLGEKKFWIRDVFQNEGNLSTPLMFFYHINIGYPILDKGAEFIAPFAVSWAEMEVSKKALSEFKTCFAPEDDFEEQQYFHEFHVNKDGQTAMALVNEKIRLGFYVKYTPGQLPYFAQWKVCRSGEYVFAFEPGNCHPIGRREQRKNGKLEILAPMEKKVVDMQLGILEGKEEIEEFKKMLEKEYIYKR